MNHPSAATDELQRGALRLNSTILAVTCGLMAGFAVFAATIWLVLKGGDTVGPHLSLLGQYFLGYRVTFVGSLVGFVYGFVVGAIGGGVFGSVYNRVVDLRSPG